jgi:predicted metal-binding membrane protein
LKRKERVSGLSAVQKAIVISLVLTSALTWILSGLQQENMMTVMSPTGILNPFAILLFTAIWTAGMAAMMFPAISPMVLLYNRLVASGKDSRQNDTSTVFEQEDRHSAGLFPAKTLLFVGSYLLVWAVTGIGLLVGWSSVMNSVSHIFSNQASQSLNIVYGSILIISGVYQFSPLKSKCLGYCESPMSFFMRRWKGGLSGALKMGIYHGIYCLGCCWPYFLLMVALGWMNLLWMGLFAGIIFGEKMWRNGIWIARIAGIGLAIVGVLMMAGYIPSAVEGENGSHKMSMEMTAGNDQKRIDGGNAMNNANGNSESSAKSSEFSQDMASNSKNNQMPEMN